MSTYERIGPDSVEEDLAGKCFWRSICHQIFVSLKKTVCSREFVKSLLLGQLVSFLLCGTAVFSGLLQQQGVHTPTAQSFLNYASLCLVFAVILACRQERQGRHLGTLLHQDGWKYAVLSLIDVEANYLVVKAYSYTTITSVQLLDCCSIVVVVVLSWLLLKAHYTCLHLLGVAISLLGLGGLVLADVLSGRNQDSEARNKGLGDLLVILGAILYGVSNVGQEFVVKNFPRTDFLGMIGLFGSIFSGIQFIVLERDEMSKIDLSSYKIWLPWLGYVACLFAVYVCMTMAIKQTNATSVNISILSADFYSLLFGLFLFHYQFHPLYIVAFVSVMLGILVYSLQPANEPVTSPQDGPCEVQERDLINGLE